MIVRPAALSLGRLRGGFILGFTLIELVIVIALIGILAAVAFPQLTSSAGLTVSLQAERFAAELRRAQGVALGQSRSLCVSAAGASYFVSSYDSVTATCSGTPVVDPAGGAMSQALESGVTISGPTGFRYRSNGAPSGTATFTLSGGGRVYEVSVADVTGTVSVAPG